MMSVEDEEARRHAVVVEELDGEEGGLMVSFTNGDDKWRYGSVNSSNFLPIFTRRHIWFILLFFSLMHLLRPDIKFRVTKQLHM
jgi:hypothetical protein